MGACSSKPKTAEFEGSMNFYLQEEMARTNLDDDQKSGCNAGLKSIGAEQTISSQCSLQNLRPKMEVEDDLMARNSGKEADMIPMDGTQVGLKKGSKEPFLVADTNESREALDSQTLGLSKVRKEANRSVKGQEYSSKQERDLIFCPDHIKVFKVVDMSKEQVIDYERHSAASQPPQTFQELKTIYGKDIASDVDEVLEKLASEFERQESLSSFLR